MTDLQDTLQQVMERFDRIFKGTVMWKEHKSFLRTEITEAVKEALEAVKLPKKTTEAIKQ